MDVKWKSDYDNENKISKVVERYNFEDDGNALQLVLFCVMLIGSVASIIVFLLECFWYHVITKKSLADEDYSNEVFLVNNNNEFIARNSKKEYIKSRETARKNIHKIRVQPSNRQILNV